MREIFLALLSILIRIQCLDFTPSDPACDTMIPTFNTNILNDSLKNSSYKIRIFDQNYKETFEYNPNSAQILYGKSFLLLIYNTI